MTQAYYLSAKDVARILNVSLSTAYKVIKEGNEKLAKEKYQTLPGKIPAPMLEKMYFGLDLNKRRDELNASVS